MSYVWPVIFSLLLIFFFYSAFKSKWPELYFSDADKVSFFISVSPRRYILFRIAPVLIVSTMVLSAFSKSFHLSELVIMGLTIGFIHSVTTNGLALYKLIRRSKTIAKFVNRVTQISFHVLSVFLLTIVGIVGGMLSKAGFINKIMPTTDGLVNNIWSSIITALAAVFLYKTFESQQMSDEEMLHRSLRSIPQNLFDLIEKHSAEKNADPILVKAVCLVENVQRPLWFRRIERFKSKLHKSGSYGIMQVHSDTPLNDEQSIIYAIDKYFIDTTNHTLHEDADDCVTNAIKSYNSEEKYAELVMKAYVFIAPNLLGYASLHR
ncbi:MAG: hypothetical protein WC734_00395 [Patescibacteria group bacterium]|jgi:hypothetical protein